MNRSKLLAILGLMVFALLGGLLAGSSVGWLAGWLIIILAALGFTAWLVNGYLWIRVAEMETAVVFNVERKSFVRFLPPGRHGLWYPLEQVKSVISTAPASVHGIVLKAQTNGGITIGANWALIYVFDPARVEPDLRPIVARVLPERAGRFLRGHINNCLSLLISQHTVDTLSDEGARGRLERELRDAVVERLAPFGIAVFRIMITAVDLPHPVQMALEAAHERELYAGSEARSLERLQRAVSQFSDNDMQRLLQLKQLHELGQNGVALPVPVLTHMRSLFPSGNHQGRQNRPAGRTGTRREPGDSPGNWEPFSP